MTAALVLCGIGFVLALVNFLRSESVVERAINFDLGFLTVVAFVTILGSESNLPYLFDFVLVAVLLSFVGSVLIVWHDIADSGFIK